MAKVTYDYTATEIQEDIVNERDFELEHDEKRIVIEIPTGLLNMVLKPEDGVLMAPGHQCRLENYVNIIAYNEQGNKCLAYLRVNGSMAGTGIRGMKRTHIAALLGKIPAFMADIDDPDIQSEYFEV